MHAPLDVLTGNHRDASDDASSMGLSTSVGTFQALHGMIHTFQPLLLVKLSLSDNKLGDHSVAKIIKSLQSTCYDKLIELRLRNNELGEESSRALAMYFLNVRTTKEWNACQKNAASVAVATGGSVLQLLDVGWNNIGDAGLALMLTALLYSPRNAPPAMKVPVKLTHLDLEWNGLSSLQSIAWLERLVVAMSTLTTLSISNNSFPMGMTGSLQEKCKGLNMKCVFACGALPIVEVSPVNAVKR